MVSYPWIWRTYILIIGKKSLYRCIYMVHTYVVQGSTELYIFGCYVYMIYLLFLSLRHVWLLETLWTTANQDFLSFTISQSLLKFTSIESVMSSNHLILWRPPLLLPSIFPNIGVFSKESALFYQVAKVLELQLQHQSFQWRTFNSLGLIGWISLQSKGLSRVFSSTTIQKHRFFGLSIL